MKCGSLKGDERKQTLDTKIYPVVLVGTKPPLVYVVEALYGEYCFSATKSLLWLFLTRHQGLPSHHGHLDPALHYEPSPRSTGSPRPTHKAVHAAPHQDGGSKTSRQATKTLMRSAHRDTRWSNKEPCSHNLLRANSSTNTHKGVLRTKSVITLYLDGLEVFFNVYGVTQNSSKL